jgi:DNA-binding response OmpR family regulator
MLPGGDGISLIASAKANGTKALLVTGHPGPMQIMTARGDPYLAKPFTPTALVAAINQLWDGSLKWTPSGGPLGPVS